VVEYDDVLRICTCCSCSLLSYKDWNTTAQRLCCERELLGVAASVGITIAPLVSNFTKPGDYAACCKAPNYEQWLEAMIKEITELEKMGC